MNKIEKIKAFIKENGYEGIQTFNCRNTTGDKMENIYFADGVMIDYCPFNHYLEIFGLTEDEWRQLGNILDI